MAAILDAAIGVSKIAAALISQSIQGAKAEQAAKAFFIRSCMAGKIFTCTILEKFIVFHTFLRYT